MLIDEYYIKNEKNEFKDLQEYYKNSIKNLDELI